MNQIEYSVLKFRPSSILDERVNIGLLILLNKELKFIYPKTLTRLKYLFPNVDLNRITEILESFQAYEQLQFQFELLDLDFESIRDNHLLIIDDNSIFFGSKLTTQTNNQDNFIKHYTDKYFSSYEQRTNG